MGGHDIPILEMLYKTTIQMLTKLDRELRNGKGYPSSTRNATIKYAVTRLSS